MVPLFDRLQDGGKEKPLQVELEENIKQRSSLGKYAKLSGSETSFFLKSFHCLFPKWFNSWELESLKT